LKTGYQVMSLPRSPATQDSVSKSTSKGEKLNIAITSGYGGHMVDGSQQNYSNVACPLRVFRFLSLSVRVSHRSQRYPIDSRTVKIDSNRSGMAKFASCFLGPSLSPLDLEGRSSIPLSLSLKKKKRVNATRRRLSKLTLHTTLQDN
jgi:hypothetical protein